MAYITLEKLKKQKYYEIGFADIDKGTNPTLYLGILGENTQAGANIVAYGELIRARTQFGTISARQAHEWLDWCRAVEIKGNEPEADYIQEFQKELLNS